MTAIITIFKTGIVFFAVLNTSMLYSNDTPLKTQTVYYYTQQTSQKNGHIVLSFVKSTSCEWGSRGQLAIERLVKDHFSSWFRYRSWSKEYRGKVYIFQSKSAAQSARNRIRSSTGVYDDNDKYTESYSYDCDYHFFLDQDLENERKERAKQEEEQRIKEERTRIENTKKAELENKRYNEWLSTGKPILTQKVDGWNSTAKSYIRDINQNYKFFKGEQLPTYLDIYELLVERAISSTTIPAAEKSEILRRVLADTYNYYKIYTTYNYKNQVPEAVFKNLNALYSYGKAQFSFHPATNAYAYLSGNSVSPFTPKNLSIEIKPYELQGIKYFNDRKPTQALFEYLSFLSNYNSSIQRLTFARQSTKNELQWRINLGIILYYNGYFKEAYSLLNKERTNIEDYYNYTLRTNYWEIYAFEIAALYYTANHNLVIKEASKFEEHLLKEYPRKDLNELSTIKIDRNKNSLRTDDVSVQNSYSKVLVYASKALLEIDKEKESSKMIKPIVKLLKKGNPVTYFGNNDNQLMDLLKIHEPKLFEQQKLHHNLSNFISIMPAYGKFEKYNTTKTWEERNAKKINEFLAAYDQKDFNLTVDLGKELLPSLTYDAGVNLKMYRTLMTKAAFAAASTKRYEAGVCFAHYALLHNRKKEEQEAYLLLLANAILANNYHYTIDDKMPFVKSKDNSVKYNFENLLATAATNKFSGVYGYDLLENLQINLAGEGETSMYLPYIYNAIKKAKAQANERL